MKKSRKKKEKKKTDQLWKDYEDHILNEGLTKKRRDKLRVMYNLIQRTLKKDLSTITKEDLKTYIADLNRNKYQRQYGGNFSGSTKADVKRFLKQFFKWYKGDNEVYPIEVSWLRGRINKDEQPEEKQVINLEQVKILANAFNKVEYRILTLILFDSGFRIGEMLSAQKKDLTWEPFTEDGQKCFWIKCNVSKTITRKVPIPLYTEDIQVFNNSSYFESLKESDNLFRINYGNYCKLLKKTSHKSLNKKITPHCLRHSSATYYVDEYDGNMRLMADKYGWSYNSKELNTYIRKSKSALIRCAKKSYSNGLGKIEEENVKLKKELDNLKDEVSELKAYFDLPLMKELKVRLKELVTK